MVSKIMKTEILYGYYIPGKGIKTLAREEKISRNTVRAYVREFAEQNEQLVKSDDKYLIIEQMQESPKYD